MARRHARADREATIAHVAATALPAFEGRVLVVDDYDGLVEDTLAGDGATVLAWRRFALRSGASAEPPAGRFDAAVLRLPRDKASLAMNLELVGARLVPGAPVAVYGANDEGIKSAPLEPVLTSVDTLWIKARARVLLGRLAADPASLRADVDAFAEEVDVGRRRLWSYPGVFAHGRLDPGSERLLRAVRRSEVRGGALDVGAGPGTLAALAGPARWTLLDADTLALRAAARNLPDAEIVVSDGLAAIDPARRFDLIVSNPPIHRGHDEDFRVVEELVRVGPGLLRRGGVMVFVVQRSAGVARMVEGAQAELREKSGRYEVWAIGG